MDIKRFISGLSALLLAACTINAHQTTPSATSLSTPMLEQSSPTIIASFDLHTPTITPSPTLTPEVRLKSGDQAFFNGDYSLAQTEYQMALANTTDPETRISALWGLGRVEYASGNNSKALIDLKDLANNYPESPNAARANFIMGEIYMALERYAEAGQAYKTYLEKRPGFLDNLVQERLGDAYNSDGNYPEAISAYQTALAAPHINDDAQLQIKIAQAYASSGDTSTALDLLDATSKASSNDYVKAQIDLLSGRLLLSLGQTDRAHERFLDAVNNYPLSFDSYSALIALVDANVPVDDLERGLINYYAGQYGRALDAFQHYISSNPNNDGTASYYHAISLIKLDNFKEGVDELTNFIKKYPDNKNWQSAWGVIAETQWSELGNFPAAAQTYLDYSKTNPDILFAPQALLNAGRIYERDGLLDEAAHVWESIADTFPGSELVPQAVFLAGIVRFRSEKFDQALITFQRDLQFSITAEDQARANFWIGKTQQALTDNTAAQSSWQQAASIDPTGYYSLRSQELLFKRQAFEPARSINFSIDLAAERSEADAWMRVTFKMPTGTNLSTPGNLLSDPRLVRGSELWVLGLKDEARVEFEDLRASVDQDPAESYELANFLLDLGLYRPAINAIRQVLTLAGMVSQAQTQAAPAYFNHIRYGMYYKDLVVPAAQQAKIDPLFLFSVIRQESLFEGFVRSSAGARGLMQITPDTGQFISDNLGWPTDYTSDDLYRPSVSIYLGATYLQQQLLRFDGDFFTSLAAYNAGPEAAQIWHNLAGSDPDLFLETVRSEETRTYIRSINEIYYMYRSLYEVIP